MAEDYSTIGSMDELVPAGTHQLSQADDHMRGIKSAIKNSFENINGVVTSSDEDLNALSGYAAANPSETIDDRISDVEACQGSMTTAQCQMLWDIGINDTVENRIAGLETQLLNVTQEEINGLIGYDYAVQGTIETRLGDIGAQIDAIIGDPAKPAFSLTEIFEIFSSQAAWNVEREGGSADPTLGASSTQLGAIRTYLNCSLPSGYTSTDLGADFQTIADKVSVLEQGNPGTPPVGGDNAAYITWTNYVDQLTTFPQGGLNVTNTLNTRERFGCLIEGAVPTTTVDFYFGFGMGHDGPKCSVVNPNKLMRISDTGKCNLEIALGGANDNFYTETTRVPGGEHATLYVQFMGYDEDGNQVDKEFGIPCIFFFDDRAPV